MSQGGGSGCRPEISNRHTESKTGGTSPRTAARRRGRVLPDGNTLSINMLPGRIWFHSGMCVTVAQSMKISPDSPFAEMLILPVKVSVVPFAATEGADLFTAFDVHTSFKAFNMDFNIMQRRVVALGYDVRSNK